MNKGTVEYDNTVLFVKDVSLLDGAFQIIAEGKGPSNAYSGPARVYGPDGLLVQDGGEVIMPAAKKNQTIHLKLMLRPSDPVANVLDI